MRPPRARWRAPASVGTFAAGGLVKPYGIALIDRGDQYFDVYVTDNDETVHAGVAPPAVYGRRVHPYDVRITGNALTSRHVRAFGDQQGDGRLFVSGPSPARNSRVNSGAPQPRFPHTQPARYIPVTARS